MAYHQVRVKVQGCGCSGKIPSVGNGVAYLQLSLKRENVDIVSTFIAGHMSKCLSHSICSCTQSLTYTAWLLLCLQICCKVEPYLQLLSR